jgi:branched-chain amino acid transport system ATP-binding protein
MKLLEVKHINTGYKKKQVLFDVSLSISKGEVLLIKGTNGSGKSTLLKAIYGLVPLWNNGEIYFEGTNISSAKTEELFNKGIVYIPQKNNVFEGLTVYENLELSGMAVLNSKNLKNRILEVFNIVPNLVSLKSRKADTLSGGEAKLLNLAMGLLSQPKLLLLDEPLSGVSPNMIQNVVSIIDNIKKLGVGIIVVEHKYEDITKVTNNVFDLSNNKFISIN